MENLSPYRIYICFPQEDISHQFLENQKIVSLNLTLLKQYNSAL